MPPFLVGKNMREWSQPHGRKWYYHNHEQNKKKIKERMRERRANNPEKEREQREKDILKLFKRYSVSSIKQFYVKKYSNPDYAPTEQEKEWIELLAAALFAVGVRRRKAILKNIKGLEPYRAYYLQHTKMFNDLVSERRENYILETELDLREEVRRQIYDRQQKFRN